MFYFWGLIAKSLMLRFLLRSTENRTRDSTWQKEEEIKGLVQQNYFVNVGRLERDTHRTHLKLSSYLCYFFLVYVLGKIQTRFSFNCCMLYLLQCAFM